jgi:peptidoglycan-associated lipoprotein
MKSIVISSVVAALLVFSGCSDKEPAVDNQAQTSSAQAQEVEAVETETVVAEESMVNSSSNAQASIADIESQLSSVYFGFDKFDIDSDTQANIATAAELGKNAASEYSVKLEGNCDEWGSDEYNFALGLKRSNAVKQALVSEGIDASRISMVSYGESNPVCTDKTQECWSKNRRVDFKLLP